MPRIPSRAAAVWPARREQRAGGSRAGGRAGRSPGADSCGRPGAAAGLSPAPRASCPAHRPRPFLSAHFLPPGSPPRGARRGPRRLPPWPPQPRSPSLGVSPVSSETSLPLLRKKKKISESLPPTPATLSPAGPPETSPSRLRFQNPRALPAVPGTPRPRPPHPRHTSRTPGPPASPHSRRRLTSAAAARAPAAGGSGAPLPAAGACSGSPQTDNEGRGLVWRQRSGAGRMPGHASFGPFLSPPTSKPKV